MRKEITKEDFNILMQFAEAFQKLDIPIRLSVSVEQHITPIHTMGKMEPVEHILDGVTYYIETEET